MKKLLRQLHCLWFGHSNKLVWKEEKGAGWPTSLEKMECTNCGRVIYIKS